MLVKSLSNSFNVPNWVGNSWERLSCETSGASCLSSCCKCHKHLHSFSCGISTPLLPRSAGTQRQRDAQKHKPLKRMKRNKGAPCTGCFIYCLICIFARILVYNMGLNVKWQCHCFDFTFFLVFFAGKPGTKASGHGCLWGEPLQIDSQHRRSSLQPQPFIAMVFKTTCDILHNHRQYQVGATDGERWSDTPGCQINGRQNERFTICQVKQTSQSFPFITWRPVKLWKSILINNSRI